MLVLAAQVVGLGKIFHDQKEILEFAGALSLLFTTRCSNVSAAWELHGARMAHGALFSGFLAVLAAGDPYGVGFEVDLSQVDLKDLLTTKYMSRLMKI